MAGEGGCGLAHQIGVLNRNGPKDHPRQPLVEPALDRRHIADTPAQLRRHFAGLQDRLNRGGIDRSASKGTVQIDKVQPLTARINKAKCLGGRIVIEYRGTVHIAMHEAHGLTVFEIDGGVEDHGRALVWNVGFLLHVATEFATRP